MASCNAHAQTDNLQNNRYSIAPALTWQFDEDTKLTVLAAYQHDNPSSPSDLPSAPTHLRPGNMLNCSFYVGDPSFDTSSRKFTNINYEFERCFDEASPSGRIRAIPISTGPTGLSVCLRPVAAWIGNLIHHIRGYLARQVAIRVAVPPQETTKEKTGLIRSEHQHAG